MTQEVSNISAWRLNKAEQKELAERVAKGECEKTAKKDIQRRKAIANENRKKAAQAVASKAAVPKASANKKSVPIAAGQQQTANGHVFLVTGFDSLEMVHPRMARVHGLNIYCPSSEARVHGLVGMEG